MSTFKFKGDWKFDLELNQISDSFTFDRVGKPNRRRDKIAIQIIDVRDENPLPESPQINAINFIIDNQGLLINSIFKHLSNFIIPKYQDRIDDDPDTSIKLTTIDDLKNHLGINRIYIFNKWKDAFAYVLFDFNSFRYI